MAGVLVSMIRYDLEGLPQFALARPFSIRWYRPGDSAAWTRIHVAADRFNAFPPGRFAEQFGADEAVLAARQAYLCDGEGREIGTATAWFDASYRGQPYGRIHWVAIMPGWQGRGLAKPLLAVACRRLRELGHERAYLLTYTARTAAVNLYLSFGFVPDIRSDEELAAWRAAREQFKPAYWRRAREAVPELA
ncbi:MAG TPA: GNAT family N-acetyltransferase [Planctomycetota bacterium]|nr:GNAT family N-acetyltransferase [Planctomycetota bacterium]HRR82799.1 GNAT family N-acetyltransferase [Planctomycetota bacterium]HRT96544.1 GNAT family N-acetyltransferase [Planctomycetota bacterium]